MKMVLLPSMIVEGGLPGCLVQAAVSVTRAARLPSKKTLGEPLVIGPDRVAVLDPAPAIALVTKPPAAPAPKATAAPTSGAAMPAVPMIAAALTATTAPTTIPAAIPASKPLKVLLCAIWCSTCAACRPDDAIRCAPNCCATQKAPSSAWNLFGQPGPRHRPGDRRGDAARKALQRGHPARRSGRIGPGRQDARRGNMPRRGDGRDRARIARLGRPLPESAQLFVGRRFRSRGDAACHEPPPLGGREGEGGDRRDQRVAASASGPPGIDPVKFRIASSR